MKTASLTHFRMFRCARISTWCFCQRCVAQLRQWLETQAHLRTARRDDSFLLRFLRFQKWRLDDAKTVLDKYVQMRCGHPEWFRGL